MSRRKNLVAVALLMAVLFSLGGCATETPVTEEAPAEATSVPEVEEVGEEPTEEEEPEVEKILVHARAQDSDVMDPAEMTSGADWKPVGQVFDTLVRYNQQMEITPHLATSWEVSDDGVQWTLDLREDVRFHDGTPLNAEAVVFTFERVYDEEHPYHEYGTWDNWSWYMYMVERVEAVDEYTVRFTLQYPYAPFLDTLSNYATAIVSPAAYEELKGEFRIQPVGSGPFKFVEWQKDDRIVLEKNPDYFLGAPKLDQLIYRVIPESSARLSALQAGEVHVLSDVPPEMADLVQEEPDLNLIMQEGLNIAYLRFNTRPDNPGFQEPLGDVRVREAMIRSIDRQALADRFFGDYGVVASNPIPPVVWGVDESLEFPEYDPDQARELLADAGYADGFETILWPWPPPRAYNPQPVQVAEAIQAYMGEIGIDVEVNVVEAGVYWDAVTQGEVPLDMSGWIGDFADPDNFLSPIWEDELSGSPYGWLNEDFRELLRAAQQATDRDERAELYQQAQEIFFEELPGLPLFHGKYIAACHNSVQGLNLRPDSELWYANVDLE